MYQSVKRPIEEYKDIHKGIPIAVLGGGHNVVNDIKKLPENAILITVNYHAESVIDCDYMVFLDKADSNNYKLKKVTEFKGIKITPGNSQFFSDVSFSPGTFPACSISSTFATWFAEYAGGSPVILCGMDLFQNKKQTHCDSRPGVSYGNIHLMSLDDHKKPWIIHRYLNKDNVYVCSGLLVGFFKEWK